MAADWEELCIQVQRELRNDDDDMRITVSKAALFIGCSKSTLDHLRLNGRGPSFKYVGNRVFYPLGELRRFVNGPLFSNTTEAKVYAENLNQSYCLNPNHKFTLHPFWVQVSTGLILAEVLSWRKNLRRALLSDDIEAVWLPCEEALIHPWADNTELEKSWQELTNESSAIELAKLKMLRIEADVDTLTEKLKQICVSNEIIS